jgi:DNA-binding NtrC family response regulator
LLSPLFSFSNRAVPIGRKGLFRANDSGKGLGRELPSIGIVFARKNRKRAEEKKVRVLIIDDDATFCQFLAEILREKGIEAEWTTDGFGGYEMSLDQPYDLFILDQRMPLVLGSELAEYLREDNPKAKIVLTSAFADKTLGEIAKSLDSPLLSKPFAANRLHELIKRLLGRSKKRVN